MEEKSRATDRLHLHQQENGRLRDKEDTFKIYVSYMFVIINLGYSTNKVISRNLIPSVAGQSAYSSYYRCCQRSATVGELLLITMKSNFVYSTLPSLSRKVKTVFCRISLSSIMQPRISITRCSGDSLGKVVTSLRQLTPLYCNLMNGL